MLSSFANKLLGGRSLLLLLALSLAMAGCPTSDDDDSAGPDDDDDTAGDDDDTTPPPDPLADVIGVMNLTNVVQAPGVSYVDFSGAFGSFVDLADSTLSPAAYLATFSYGADAPYWRLDLGAFPIPAEGEYEVVDMYVYYPWVPDEETWWEAGNRIGLGNYLTSRLDLEDVVAYQVDDPVSPGAAGWTAGGTLDWQNPGGVPVIDWEAPASVTLPDAVEMVEPQAHTVVSTPAALDYEVRWTPGSDGAIVTIGVINEYGMAYIARVPDTGTHLVPGEVLHDEFGPGQADLVVGRTLEQQLEHPQGAILMRTREERRAVLDLLPDVVLEPAFGEPGDSVSVEIGWFTADLSAGLTADFGDGIVVGTVTPVPGDSHRAQVLVQVDGAAVAGPRDVTLTLAGGEETVLAGGFAVLDLTPSDTCDDANAMAPLLTGSYSSTTSGLGNDFVSGFSCLPWSLNGADAVYVVELEARETLIATLSQPDPGDPALALLSACNDLSSSVACADSGLGGESETLVHTSEFGGTFYLVIDAWLNSSSGAYSSAFDLDIVIERDLLDPDWIVPGETRSFTLQGDTPWEAGILQGDIDLGDGLGVASTPVISDTDLSFPATAAPGASTGPRTITVNQPSAGPISFPDVLWVSGWPIHDTCAAASAAPGVFAGSREGWAVRTSSTIDDVPCMPFASTGPEVFIPVDLGTGASMDVVLTSSEDTQLYVLSDCTLPESCFEDAAIDEAMGGESEVLSSWSPPSAGRYYLVLDLWSSPLDPLAPWQFELDLVIQ